MVDTRCGSVKVASAANGKQVLHMLADVGKLAVTTTSSPRSRGEQPVTAVQKLLATLLVPASELAQGCSIASVSQPRMESASDAQSEVTSTDASLQLGSVCSDVAAGMAVKWDVVQMRQAHSHMQHHAVAEVIQATAEQRNGINSVLEAAWSSSVSVQGLQLTPLSAFTPHVAGLKSTADSSPAETAGDQQTEQPWISSANTEEHFASVQAVIVSVVTRLLGSDSIGHDEPLMAAGLDSLGATELVQSLETAFGTSLPATLVFDYPTVAAMAGFLTQHTAQVGQSYAPQPHRGPVVLRQIAPGVDDAAPVAVIAGVAGDQKLLQQWTHGDAITAVPHSRWDTTQQGRSSGLSDVLAPQFGSFLSSVDQFDSALLGIMASEGLTMDPQQRLLLQVALEAFPNGPSQARGRAIGAYVGIGTSDYNSLMQQAGMPFNAFSFTAGSASVASGRLSFAFGLQEPTASIDTACSASLVAAHMACQSFR